MLPWGMLVSNPGFFFADVLPVWRPTGPALTGPMLYILQISIFHPGLQWCSLPVNY